MRQVLTAQEEERKRLARELHDETAQSLLLILQIANRQAHGSERKLPAQIRKGLDELRSMVLQTLADLRRLTRDLRPQILDDMGLVAAVEWLAEETERQSGITTTVGIVGSQRPLAPEAQLLLFRIAQEALSNVRRHSAALAAGVLLEFADGRVRLSVEDDGRGFRMPASLSELAGPGYLFRSGSSEAPPALRAAGPMRSLTRTGKAFTLFMPSRILVDGAIA